MLESKQRSLFGEILDWMLTPLLLLWPFSLVLTWLVAQNIAAKPFDRMLEYNAQTLAELIVAEQGQAKLMLPRPANQLLKSDGADPLHYQIRGGNGELLGGERDLPVPPVEEEIRPAEVRVRDVRFRGVDFRVAYIWVKLNIPETHLALVQVAESMEKRSLLAAEITKGVMLPQLIILPLAMLLIWLAFVQAIKPLNRLEERIRARSPDDLSPLDIEAVPLEVAPLVSSVNDLLLRLKYSISTQRRFLADAAHQLKTPLAGLRMQADLAQRENASAEDLKQSLRQIGRSSIRATHTVNQLLALARAESSGAARSFQACDLARLTMEVVRDCVPRAMDKHIDVGYDGAQPETKGVSVMGNPILIKEMVRNLVDNAINYTPSSAEKPGVVTARAFVEPVGNVPVIQVEDSGPGIAPALRELVFQPFYRALGNDADGSGLGLAIVLKTARKHGASVTIEDRLPGHSPPGVRFTVRFTPQVHDA